jgi:hypothetical protein
MRLAVTLIKGVHTVAFVIIAGAILTILVDGLRGQPSRRTGMAATIALAECAVYAGNGFVCPVTPLAERLGATDGAVSDIFLPDWVARNLAWIATPILVGGLALNARAVERRLRGGSGWPGVGVVIEASRSSPPCCAPSADP